MAPYPRGGLLWLLRTYGESRRNSEAFGLSPIEFFMRLSGDASEFRDIAPYAFFERTPVYLVNHPEAVGQVLTSPVDTYTKRGTRLFEVGQRIWGQGLFTIEGEEHLQHRRSLHPLFQQLLGPLLEGPASHATQELLGRWEHGDSVRDVQQDLLPLALAILCASLMGDVSEEEQRRLAQLVDAVQLPLFKLLGATVILPAWIPVPSHRQLRQVVCELMSVIAEIVHRREARHGEGNECLLDGLLQARQQKPAKQYIYDEVATMLFGGYRTTAVWIMWAWYLLSQHPAIEEQLQEELASVLGGRSPSIADLPNLSFLDMVLDETLRLYPPTWMMDRRANAATSLCGVPIPRGSLILVCPYTLHRHPAYWERPNDFYPEHFRKDLVQERPKYAFCPFGAGRHMCVGRQFAEMVTKLALIIMMQRYSLRLDPPDYPVELAARDALYTSHGMPMRLNPRKESIDAGEGRPAQL